MTPGVHFTSRCDAAAPERKTIIETDMRRERERYKETMVDRETESNSERQRERIGLKWKSVSFMAVVGLRHKLEKY